VHPALTIRAADEGDLPALTTLERELFGGCSYPYSVLRQTLDTFESGLQIAAHGTAIVGYSLTVQAQERDTAWLWSMGVHPAHRREGVGTRLVVNVLDTMQRLGVERLLLTVDPANDVATSLYTAFDFKVTADVADYFGPGERRLVMERRG
jgi:ribosomal protein S18 acetylase RimI-like enzyme